MRDISDIIRDLDEFKPVNDDWSALDLLIDEAIEANSPQLITPLLSILERNQSHDGFGVFWSIVHGLESMDGYEAELKNSVLRKPHELSVVMLNRLVNSSVSDIAGTPINALIEQVAMDVNVPEDIRETAKDLLDD
ncbi:hypothetical protein EXY25_14860 [Corallincola spongiicola]|uniref:Immunity protein 30 domain-containing protein n=2 Tax=Corallincola spongiicola TaxID=2520508 RepID=A0ABY1WLT7_9GAMM|nr:hypothetical protein EXY25_14860 [Corallincola spongiicola]